MSANNPAKNYDFALEIDGVVQAYMQGVTAPKVEFTEHKQGNQGNRPDKKTPGKKVVGDMTIEKVVPALEGDPEIWLWFQSAAVNIRAAYARSGFLVELNDGIPGQRFFIDEAWVKSIESATYDTRGDNSADMLRTVVLSIGDYLPV